MTQHCGCHKRQKASTILLWGHLPRVLFSLRIRLYRFQYDNDCVSNFISIILSPWCRRICLPADVRGRRSCPFSTTEPRSSGASSNAHKKASLRDTDVVFTSPRQLLCLPPPAGPDPSVFLFFFFLNPFSPL